MLFLELERDGDVYNKVDVDSLSAAKNFISQIFSVAEREGIELVLPSVEPCISGDVDVVWKQGDARLLVTFENTAGGVLRRACGFTARKENLIDEASPANVANQDLYTWIKKYLTA